MILWTIILVTATGLASVVVSIRAGWLGMGIPRTERLRPGRPIRTRLSELEENVTAGRASHAGKVATLAAISHDLGASLHAVVGCAQLLDRDLAPGERAEYVASIQASANTLLGLADQALDLGESEAGNLKLAPEATNVRRIVEEVELTMRPPGGPTRIALSFHGPVSAPVILDPGKLRRILQNLVGNALKFSTEGVVAVHTSCREAQVAISVSDAGTGIDSEALPGIFEAFAQADAGGRHRPGGRGLGLAICKSFVEAMGGEISVVSVPGKGSRFSFWVPAKPPMKPEEKTRGKAGAPVMETRISRTMVVEDNIVSRRVLLAMLGRHDISAASAASGRECLKLCSRSAYDLILLDLEMPDMDGFETARELRRQEADTPTTPPAAIVALSGNVTPGVEERCFAAGMNGYLSKPVSMTALLSTIQQFARAPERTNQT
jgi:signal transduction histidine kinase/ActR/RegA family two-component response regulator